ncbi:MAG: hypothetical protein H6Q84_3171, partial [Deltaproteobacteria bacterium]|nr:hypothetical protein [Deltaproteobacteria bacterium]
MQSRLRSRVQAPQGWRRQTETFFAFATPIASRLLPGPAGNRKVELKVSSLILAKRRPVRHPFDDP